MRFNELKFFFQNYILLTLVRVNAHIPLYLLTQIIIIIKDCISQTNILDNFILEQ